MSDIIVPYLRQYEYGDPTTGGNYLRVEFGYFKNQLYISGIYKKEYFSVLFDVTDRDYFEVLLVLAGSGTVAKWEKGQKLSLEDIRKWFDTLITKKQRRANKVLKAFLED